MYIDKTAKERMDAQAVIDANQKWNFRCKPGMELCYQDGSELDRSKIFQCPLKVFVLYEMLKIFFKTASL